MSKKPILRTNLTVSMNEMQRDMLDFAVTVIHHDRYSNAALIVELIRNNLKNYVGLGIEDIALSDEEILDMAIEKNNLSIKAVLGEEKFNQLMNQRKEGDKNE